MELNTSVKTFPKKDVTVFPSFGKIFNTFIPAIPRFFHKLLIPWFTFLEVSYL